MTPASTQGAPEPTPWHTPTAGPIAVLTHPNDMRALMRTLRPYVSRHADTAWVHPVVSRNRDALTNLGQDLLDAIGVVGLTPPRAVGEAHLLRPLTHLVHGPVRHIVIDDAVQLPTHVLTELHEAAIIGRTQLWLLVDTTDGTINGLTNRKAAAFLAWVNDTCTPQRPHHVQRQWENRPVDHPACHAPEPSWWLTPLKYDELLPAGCPDHANLTGTGHITCLLAWVRRALTSGHLAPGLARRRLTEYTEHPATTVTDRWALTAAGRDLLTPGADALRLAHPRGESLTLGEVDPNGAAIRVDGAHSSIPPEMQTAVARLRTSRRLAGCLSHEPMYGLFDQVPGRQPRRR